MNSWMHLIGNLFGAGKAAKPPDANRPASAGAGRRQAQAIRPSDGNFPGALLDCLADPIYVKDLQGRYVIVNAAAARMLGADSAKEFIGKTGPDCLAPELAVHFRNDETAVLKTGAPVLNRTEPVVDQKGATRWFLRSTFPLHDTQGRLAGLAGISRDITEMKQARESLRLQGAALAASTSGIVITDRTGLIVWANQAFTDLTGYTLAEARGRNLRMIKSGRQNSEFYNRLWKTIVAGKVWSGELINKRKDNTFYCEEMTITPLRDELRQITHYVAVKNDITERKQFQQEKVQAQKMESIGRLAGGIAHDFNNILQTILGFSDLIMKSMEADNPHRSDLKEIHAAASRAATLTRQLLAFSRKQVINPVPLNLNVVLRNMANMLRSIIGEDIRLATVLDSNLSLVNADAGQIETIITNLVANARDAMPKGGRLTITTSNFTVDKQDAIMIPDSGPGAFVCLTVSDSGIGMDQETIRNIFEPFYTTKASGKGTGLGLASIYGIAKQHNGWINAYSERGQGSTFKLYLPAIANQPVGGQAAQATLVVKERRGSGQRILLVEDEISVQKLACTLLRANGYRVEVAGTAREAADIFLRENGNFDLIFCDVILPDRNGIQLVEQFVAGKPALRIIMTSGYSDQQSRWPTIQAKGWRFLQKPYPVATLLQAVAADLHSNQAT